jgi:acyl-lipid omega-6 desaturase (Delta-12 desaturase)
MSISEPVRPKGQEDKSAREWIQTLSRYREPRLRRSLFELAITFLPFVLLWALAWWALSFSHVLAVAIAVLNGAFLLRLFAIQHDCGHGAFFGNRMASDWVGRILGVLTLTPYHVWRRTHSIHHSAAGNLARRGIGDVHTLTVAEYRALSPLWRFHYRLYRHPLTLFGLGPGYIFFLQNRLPIGLMRAGWRYWVSAMGTNAMIAALLAAILYFGGLAPLLLVFLPSTLIAASVGVWLFYIQHQFEDTNWNREEDWQLHQSAMHGSSHYDLPRVLRWFTANIGVHHVHHLYARIPFYRLTEVLRDHAVLANMNRMTLAESFACSRLHLWDEQDRRLLSFRQERERYGAI